MKRVLKVIGIILVALIILILGYFMINQNKSYPEDITYMEQNAIFNDGYYEIDNDSDTGIIFYTGAKVDPRAYAYLGEIIDVNIYIPKFLFNFTFFKPNVASSVIEKEENINNWYMAGHSLGGVFASNYAFDNTDVIDGVIYLGSYPAQKDTTDLRSLAIFSTEDGLIEDVEVKKELFNDNTKVVEILGGNHSQFGNYDLQKGDKEAYISGDIQHDTIIKLIESFVYYV